jgi:hypothetical protein
MDQKSHCGKCGFCRLLPRYASTETTCARSRQIVELPLACKLPRYRHVGGVGVFILCVNLWRYSNLMRSSTLTLWGRGQSKSLFYTPAILTLCVNPQEKGKKDHQEKDEGKLLCFYRHSKVRFPTQEDWSPPP